MGGDRSAEVIVVDWLIRRAKLIARKYAAFLGYAVVMFVFAIFIPVGDTLWAKVLHVSGEIRILKGGEGCTPGFWKQEHHFSSWPDGYSPDTEFQSKFMKDIQGNPTLLEALQSKGGGLEALKRHATAALLNTASFNVDYAFSVTQVIGMFQTAFESGDPDQIETTKDKFDAANEAGCPLPVKESRVDSKKLPAAAAAAISSGTPTATSTETPVAAPTNSPTVTPTSTLGATSTDTPTATSIGTPEATPTDTPTSTETPQPTATNTPTSTPSDTPTATATNTPAP